MNLLSGVFDLIYVYLKFISYLKLYLIGNNFNNLDD